MKVHSPKTLRKIKKALNAPQKKAQRIKHCKEHWRTDLLGYQETPIDYAYCRGLFQAVKRSKWVGEIHRRTTITKRPKHFFFDKRDIHTKAAKAIRRIQRRIIKKGLIKPEKIKEIMGE